MLSVIMLGDIIQSEYPELEGRKLKPQKIDAYYNGFNKCLVDCIILTETQLNVFKQLSDNLLEISLDSRVTKFIENIVNCKF
jgi:hypothetical protein